MDPVTAWQRMESVDFMKRPIYRFVFILSLVWAGLFFGTASTGIADAGIDFNTLPIRGTVTMIDLGAKK